LRSVASSSFSAVVATPGLPLPRSARARSTQFRTLDSVRSRSRATCGMVLPSSRTRRTAPALNSSVKLLRGRFCFFPSAMSDTVPASRLVSTRSDQAQKSPESPEAYALWLKAILHLTYARESSGGDASELLGRVLATNLDYRPDPNEYPPTMLQKANALRAALKAGPINRSRAHRNSTARPPRASAAVVPFGLQVTATRAFQSGQRQTTA